MPRRTSKGSFLPRESNRQRTTQFVFFDLLDEFVFSDHPDQPTILPSPAGRGGVAGSVACHTALSSEETGIRVLIDLRYQFC